MAEDGLPVSVRSVIPAILFGDEAERIFLYRFLHLNRKFFESFATGQSTPYAKTSTDRRGISRLANQAHDTRIKERIPPHS